MSPAHKPLVWLHGELKSPPLSAEARQEAGFLLRRLQRGDLLGLPVSRPMPVVGRRCHELRIQDASVTWRVLYRLDEDAVVILAVFSKKTQKTPAAELAAAQRRLRDYETATRRNS